jgi:F-type H+-transporting ATPase subunit delta
MSRAVAVRYARALFAIAQEQGKVREYVDQAAAFAAAYRASADFRGLELTPTLSDDDRRGVVEEIGRRLEASPSVVRTVVLLAERGRLGLLPSLAAILGDMADEDLGVTRVRVTSAQELSDGYRDRLRRTIEEATGKRVILDVTVDPSLIGGLVTEIGDRVIDGSLRGRLARLAEVLR